MGSHCSLGIPRLPRIEVFRSPQIVVASYLSPRTSILPLSRPTTKNPPVQLLSIFHGLFGPLVPFRALYWGTLWHVCSNTDIPDVVEQSKTPGPRYRRRQVDWLLSRLMGKFAICIVRDLSYPNICRGSVTILLPHSHIFDLEYQRVAGRKVQIHVGAYIHNREKVRVKGRRNKERAEGMKAATGFEEESTGNRLK